MNSRATVIVYRPSALGDVAMTIPAIYTLALSNPELRVVAATSAKFSRLFINRPDNLEVFPIEKSDFKNPASLYRMTCRLDSLNPVAFIDLHNTLRSWTIDMMLRLRGRRVVMLDKRRAERRAILRHHFSTAHDFTQRYFDVIAKAGFNLDTSLFNGFKFEKQPSSSDHRRVGIAPFARYATKTYPSTMMERVVEQLNTLGGYDIYLFGGGQSELAILNEWQQRYPAVAYVSGSLTLDAEIQLMGTLDVMVSMDSANMHLASLVATRVISIWGGTTPDCGFIGWRQHRSDAMVANLPCQPCSIAGTKECPLATMACLKAITPEKIKAHIDDVCSDYGN